MPRRIISALPWLAGLVAIVVWMLWDYAGEAVARPGLPLMLSYAGNYLASRVLHFARPLALPWLCIALVVAAFSARALPWQK